MDAQNIPTDEAMDELGRVADSLDAALYAARLPLDPKLHIEGLTGSIRTARDKIVEFVVGVTGENPWEHNKLEG